ncbi:hypothetical protein D3C72_1382430 [compost metagenome]
MLPALLSHSSCDGANPCAARASACGGWGGCNSTMGKPGSCASAGASSRNSPLPGCCTSRSMRLPLGQPPPGSCADRAAKPVSRQRVAPCPSCDARHKDGCKASGEAIN